ncbi:histone acetyltransferases subunit 3-domain-containing protein [Morchella snyderi]|nr:histone acetyltransferases subunit 3-domain-containing protein [Morchella snyderi]
MSGKGGKGKGKTRGGGPGGASSQRRSRSRNTTPASTSAFSEITHLSTEAIGNLRVNYDEVLEKYVNNSSSDSSSIPTSTNLSSLRSELLTLDSNAKGRSRVCDKSLRDLSNKIELKKNEEKEKERQEKMEQEQEQQERKRKAAEDEEEREKKAERDKVKEDKDRKRKEKKSGDGKRPLAIGAHQPTDQGPSDTKDKRKKQRGESPSRTSTSPSKSRTSDAEHQPVPAPPYTVLETLDDDPTIYEIPTSTEGWPYEKKAKAFSVTRFPTIDLTDLGPGDPPDEDFSKAKPSNQVAMNTFNTYIDPYFRPFSEEDLGFLRERGNRVTPYIMPTLGQHYSEVWAAEDGSYASPAPASNKNPNVPKGSSDALTDDALEKEEISCGPLLSRIMAAMIPEEGTIDPAPEPDTPTHDSAPSAPSATTMPEATQSGWKVPTGKSDYYTLEERLQKEMQYIGLLGTNSEPDWKAREDDDVSAKLRELQKQLREQSLINGARKARIAEHLKEQLAHQEYATILDDLDKQVEQAYSKRTRNMKATKKKKSAPNGVGVAQARIGIGEAARTLMERRKKWMSSIGPVFDENITRLPAESIFQSMEELLEKEKEGAAEDE